MGTKNTNTTNKTSKRESTFDADKFLDSYEEGCREVDALLFAARTQPNPVSPPEPPKKKRPAKKAPTDDIDISTIDFNIIRADDPSGSKRHANLFKLPEADADDLAENSDKAVVATETAVIATTDKSATTVEMTETVESNTLAKTTTPVAPAETVTTDKVGKPSLGCPLRPRLV